MRTAAQETALQIALKDFSEEAVEWSIYKILVKGEFSAINRLVYKWFSAG